MSLIHYSRVRSGMAMGFVLLNIGCAYTDIASVRNDNGSTLKPSSEASISGNGRFTVFQSLDTFGDSSDFGVDFDIFVHDHQLGITERVTVDSNGVLADGTNVDPVISDDGNVVAFRSTADDLVPGDTNGMRDVFVYDRQTSQFERVNVDSNENQSAGDITIGRGLAISEDGRYVAFDTRANGLVSSDTDNNWDVYVRDRVAGVTEIVSVDTNENHTSASSFEPSISDDGRYIAFTSGATWGPLDTNGELDIYVRDRISGSTSRVSINNAFSLLSNGMSTDPSISGNGVFIAFESTSTDLVSGDTNGETDVFVFNRSTGFSKRASTVSYSTLDAYGASDTATVSDDGRFVAFRSVANNLVADDTNGVADFFVKDMGTLRTFRVSATQSGGLSSLPAEITPGTSMSNDGRYVTFSTSAQLSDEDSNTFSDVYHRFALEPGPLTGGGSVAAGSSAGVPVISGGWLDPVNVAAAIIPKDDITINDVIWAGFPGSESVVLQITIAPGAAQGPRHIVLWNPGQWGGLSGASAICNACLVVN